MTNIYRVCPECGGQSPLEARHCPSCGYDSQSGLPAQPPRNLPATIGKAALPVLAGAMGLAVRAAWKLLQSRLAQDAVYRAANSAVARGAETFTPQVAPPAATPPQIVPTQTAPTQSDPTQRPKRTVRIRSSWAVGDANGTWRQGKSEHTIEFDD